VGQAGSGFNQKSLSEISSVLKKLATNKNPFFGDVDALRKVSFVKPELVAEIEFAEWTGGNTSSRLSVRSSQSRSSQSQGEERNAGGSKLRAPVFLGLRDDKDPKHCRLDQDEPQPTEN
jgi:ATP-dependent DNA ligase